SVDATSRDAPATRHGFVMASPAMPATVLIIEDNEDSRVIMSVWLEHAGYRVVLARDGVCGVALARSIMPIVILMDVALPEMDGWTAARTLRDDPLTRHIPIIALTAMALPQDA